MADAPKIVHRYEIVERLGQGGMGDLYLGRDPMLDRFVAIKMLKAGLDADDLRERFAREAKSAARLAHVNIVTIYDVGEHEGQPYIAMEYVLGETLLDKIRRRSDLPLATKLQYVDELCAGLAHAHKAGIIHRDIKPANLIVAAEGALKILDFGIARLADSSMTQSGMMLGTLNYMSPEQISGPVVDHRSDIFAVGAVFYELLSYQQAFPGAIDVVLSSILYGTPASLSQVCPGLDASIVEIVEKALAKSPDERFDDLTTMRSELAKARDRMDRKVLAAPVTTSRISPGRMPISIPTPGGRTPRRGTTSREEIKRRRAEELAGHLNAARSLFAAGKFEEASAACERALIIEGDNDEAADLSERARAAIEQNQIRSWATEARAEVERGNIDAAQALLSSIVSLDADSAEARSLRGAISQLEARRQADKAVVDGRQSLESGDAAAAAAAAREALRANPTNAGAASLLRDASVLVDAQRRKAEHDRQARDAVLTARRRFESGDHAAALAELEQFSPSHAEVDAAMEELRGELREIRAREYALSQQAAAELVIAQAWLARDDLVEAEIAVERARLIAPDDPAIAEIEKAIETRRAQIDARHQADEEARRQADLARQRAESEARRRTDEETRRKTAEARVKAGAEARRQADEEARRQAEDEERRRADEEAQLEAARLEEEARRLEEDARLEAEAGARRAEEARRAEQKRRAEEARRAEESRRAAEERRREDERRREAARREAEEAQRQEEAAQAAAEAEEARRKSEDDERQRESAEAEARRQTAEAVTEQRARGKDAKKRGDAPVITEPAKPTEAAAPVAPAPLPAVALAKAGLMSAPPPATRAGAGAKQMVPLAAAAVVVLVLLGVGIWQFSGDGDPVTTTTATSPPAATPAPVTRPDPQAAPPQATAPPAATDTPAAPPTAPAATDAPAAATPTADPAAVDAMRRQATQLIQRNDRLQALAVVEKGLRASPGDAQLQQMVTTLLRDAQQSTTSAKDEAVKAEAPKFAESAFGEGTRLEADAAAKARAADRPGSIRSLFAATDAFGKSTAAARDASGKANAAEAQRQREAEEKQRLADLAREKQLADAKLEADRKLKEQPRPEVPQPPPAAVPPKGNAPALPSPAADEEAVRATLKQYEAAYESLDVAAVTRVFSGARANQLAAAFKQYRSYELDILVESIQFGPQRMQAMVAARVTYTVQPVSGRRVNSTQAQQFVLAREPGGWRIEAVK